MRRCASHAVFLVVLCGGWLVWFRDVGVPAETHHRRRRPCRKRPCRSGTRAGCARTGPTRGLPPRHAGVADVPRPARTGH